MSKRLRCGASNCKTVLSFVISPKQTQLDILLAYFNTNVAELGDKVFNWEEAVGNEVEEAFIVYEQGELKFALELFIRGYDKAESALRDAIIAAQTPLKRAIVLALIDILEAKAVQEVYMSDYANDPHLYQLMLDAHNSCDGIMKKAMGRSFFRIVLCRNCARYVSWSGAA